MKSSSVKYKRLNFPKIIVIAIVVAIPILLLFISIQDNLIFTTDSAVNSSEHLRDYDAVDNKPYKKRKYDKTYSDQAFPYSFDYREEWSVKKETTQVREGFYGRGSYDLTTLTIYDQRDEELARLTFRTTYQYPRAIGDDFGAGYYILVKNGLSASTPVRVAGPYISWTIIERNNLKGSYKEKEFAVSTNDGEHLGLSEFVQFVKSLRKRDLL